PVRARRSFVVQVEPPDDLRSSLEEQLLDTELPRKAHSPGPEDLASDLIVVLGLTFEQQDARPGSRHDCGQGAAGNATTHDHEVVLLHSTEFSLGADGAATSPLSRRAGEAGSSPRRSCPRAAARRSR